MFDHFPFVEIFVPVVAFAIVIFCCVSLCRSLQRVRREHLENQPRTVEIHERPSVYIIPFSPSEEEVRRPPRYSTMEYSPPPSYHELEFKPDFIPCDPPPAYIESIPTRPTNSTPDQPSTARLEQSRPTASAESV